MKDEWVYLFHDWPTKHQTCGFGKNLMCSLFLNQSFNQSIKKENTSDALSCSFEYFQLIWFDFFEPKQYYCKSDWKYSKKQDKNEKIILCIFIFDWLIDLKKKPDRVFAKMDKCTNQMDKFLYLYAHAWSTLTVIKWKEIKCVFCLFLHVISTQFLKSKKHYHSQV